MSFFSPGFKGLRSLALTLFVLLPVLPAGADYCTNLNAELRAIGSGKSVNQLHTQLRAKRAVARRSGCLRGFLFMRVQETARCANVASEQTRLRREIARGSEGTVSPGLERRRVTLLREVARKCTKPSAAARRIATEKPGTASGGTFRSLCVRTCDGYYFPISYSSSSKRLKVDEAVCKRIHGSGADLYFHRSDEFAEAAVSLGGLKLARQPFAFAYRHTYDPGCFSQLHAGLRSLTAAIQAIAAEREEKGVDAALLVPLPRPRPQGSEDSETIANQMAGFRLPATHIPAMRLLGEAYYYAESPVVGALEAARQLDAGLGLTQAANAPGSPESNY